MRALLLALLLPISAGAFDIQPNTVVPSLTVSGGEINAAGQPFISLSSPTTNPILTGGFASLFWVNVDTNTNTTFDAANSSDTVTVTTAGRYQAMCQVHTNDATTTLSVRIRANGITQAQVDIDPISGSDSTARASKVLDLAAGSTIQCQGYDTGGGYWSTGISQSYFQVYKLP